MDIRTALKIKLAVVSIQEELGIPAQKLGSLINLYDENCYKKLREASELWNKFDESTTEERAKMLGYVVSD